MYWPLPLQEASRCQRFACKRQALMAFMDLVLAPRLVPNLSRARQWLKALCLIGAVGSLVLALMQPQWGQEWQEVQRQGRDIMILLDVSRSMLAEDVVPNRLACAKSDLQDLVQVLQQEGGHRLGLVVFAGQASLQCPLTLDYGFFLQRLHRVGPDTVVRGGTLIGDAIRKALSAFATLANNYKDIILITDGEDHDSFPLEAAQAAAAQQVSIYTIGVGDALTGTRIPVQDTIGHRTYVQYQGQEVRSRLQTDLLLEIARITGAAYVPAGTRAIELDRIYAEKIAPKARRQMTMTKRERFIHRYQWVVLAGLLLLGVEMLVDSLDVDPQQQDARYNLELSHLLLHKLQQEQPQLQGQPQPSQPQQDQQAQQDGPQHAQPQDAQQQSGQPQEAQPQDQQQTASQAQPESPPDASQAHAQPPEQPMAAPQELRPEEASRLLEAIRERAHEADHQWQQQRRAKAKASQVDKDW